MGYKMKGAPVHYGTKAHKSALKQTITPEGQANLDKYKADFKKHTEYYEKNKDKYKMDEKGQYRNIKTNASVKEDVNKTRKTVKDSPAKQTTNKERLNNLGKKVVEYTFNPPKGIKDFHDSISGGDKKGSKGASGISKKAGEAAGEAAKDAATRKKMKDVETKRRKEELQKIKKVKRKKAVPKKKVKKDIPKTIKKPDPIKVETDKNTPDPNPNFYERKNKVKKKGRGMTKEEIDKIPKGA